MNFIKKTFRVFRYSPLILAGLYFCFSAGLPQLLFAQDVNKQCACQNENSRGNPVIRLYQEYISGADGNRCPMYPCCSSYAAQAVEKHGLFMGWIMACDRIVRCGRDEAHLSPHVTINGSRLIYDPLKANDFWWFSPKTPPCEKTSQKMDFHFTAVEQCPVPDQETIK